MQFTQDFFKPEIREGFEIPAMMKRAWAAQMEVLQVVADICEENGLQYFADGGTLLGAVRHQGFIPWDDDIDICLKREDYNRLISILQRQLPYGFVVSGMYAGTVRLRMAANVSHLRVIADETLWNFNDYMKVFSRIPLSARGNRYFSTGLYSGGSQTGRYTKDYDDTGNESFRKLDNTGKSRKTGRKSAGI
jgi:lipopolysaccharide cholinephosphotransferase